MFKQGFLNDNENNNEYANNNLGPLQDKRSYNPNTPSNRVKFLWSQSTPAAQRDTRNKWVNNTPTPKKTIVSEDDVIEEFKTEAEEAVKCYDLPGSGLSKSIEEEKRKEREELWRQTMGEGALNENMVEERSVDNIQALIERPPATLTNTASSEPTENPPAALTNAALSEPTQDYHLNLKHLTKPPNTDMALSPANDLVVTKKDYREKQPPIGSSPSKIILPQPPHQIQFPLPQDVYPPQIQPAHPIYPQEQVYTQELYIPQDHLLGQPYPPTATCTPITNKKHKSTETTTEEGEIVQVSSLAPKPDNPYTNIPTLPHKTSGAPKNALQAYFMQNFSIQITNEHFKVRSNNGPPHDIRWTCTFTTPNTNEQFACGKYGDARFYCESLGVVWYKKRKLAEHAAAARALDCLMYRDFQKDSSSWRICVELPYGERRDNDELYTKKRGLEMQIEDDKKFREDYQALRLRSDVGMEEDEDQRMREDDEDQKMRDEYNALKLGENFG